MGCVASNPAPSIRNATPGVLNPQLDTLPGEQQDNLNGEADSRTPEDGPGSSSKYTPRDTKRASITQGALLSMAMEADGDTNEVVSTRTNVSSHVAIRKEGYDEHADELPDLAYSMREKNRGVKQGNETDTSSMDSGSSSHQGLSKNVVVNRPTVHNLQPGAMNNEFSDQHGGHILVPMQSFGAGGPRGMPYVSMPRGNPGHPLQMLNGYPHGAFHLSPLDPSTHLSPTGPVGPVGQQLRDLGNSGLNVMGIRGRGRGLPTIVVGPMAAMGPGGFRGSTGVPTYNGGVMQPPVVMGRGRGSPLQIVIPTSQNSHRGELTRLPVEASMRGKTSDPPIGKSSATNAGSIAPRTGDGGDDEGNSEDDDNEGLVEDDEEVEDWTVDVSPPREDGKTSHSKAVQLVDGQTLGPTKAPPPMIPGTSTTMAHGSVPGTTKKNFRPAFAVADDTIEAVELGSDADIDSDDDDNDSKVGDDENELHDWLDTSRDLETSASRASLKPSSPLKTPKFQDPKGVGQSQTTSTTPQASPIKSGRVQPTPTPTNRQGHHVPTGSPHPPLPTQQASIRQLHTLGGTGSISPTRPAGPPPIGSSPTKPPSYRSNIIASGAPPLVPHLQSVTSPVASSGPGEQAAAPIRDTKVVKKKKAELPQTNLPHPTPKFGDWLNSRTMINNYIILESLGAGSYAEVKLCKEKVTGKLFAMKFINRDIMKKDKLGKQSKLDDIKREIAIMKKLNHPNVLRLYEVMDDPSMNKLFLVLEYMKHGDLLSHQKKKNPNGGNLHDRDLHCVTLQVILGLAYLHEQKIVHGDIKPQNLLVGDKDVVKIADFGISQSLYGSKQKLSDTAGTPAFMSPEMCSGEEYSGQLADIWAVGATIFMLKFGQPPFVAKSAMQMFERIQNDPLVFPGPIDPMLEDLLRGMLTKNPLKRTTLLQIMTHPWVTKEEHPSHFVPKEKTPQITVTNEEVDNAIDASDKFAIIVNIRVQMMKRLQAARNEILKRRQQAGGAEDSHAASHQMLKSTLGQAAGDGQDSVSTTPTAQSQEGLHADKLQTKRGTKSKSRKNRVFADASGSAREPVGAGESKILSKEEIQYRSQLFSRKKASGTSGASSAAFPKLHDHDNVADTALDLGSVDSEDDEDEISSDDDDDDDDDEHAVSQSPQLLDELLLTTLSMPPLSKSSHPTDPTTRVAATHPVAGSMPSPHPSPITTTHQPSHATPDHEMFYAENKHLNVSIAVASLQGRRNIQEDRWAVVADIDSNASSRWSQSLFAGMYDGHGGDECATILQDQFHAWLFRAPDELFASPDRIRQSFLDFDAFLCDFLLHKGDLSGSTATCVFVDRAHSQPERGVWNVLVGHVGDCRVLLTSRQGGAVHELTQDHRLTLTAERDRVLALGGRVVNNRVNGVMAITRAFGDLEFKGLLRSAGSLTGLSSSSSSSSSSMVVPENVRASPFQRDDERTPALLTARPDVLSCRVDAARHEFLVLACDGLWDVMASEEAAEILRDRVHFHGDLALAAKELAQEGIRRFSNDNISVLVVRFPDVQG